MEKRPRHERVLQFIQTDNGGNSSHVLWNRSGNQGQKWWLAYVTIPFVNDDVFKFQFKSRRRFGIRGDIAVRNVTTDPKPCLEDAPYDCDFDKTMCDWRQSLTDTGNWTLAQGLNNNTDFAPSSDHTTGSAGGGYLLLSLPQSWSGVYVPVVTTETLCVSFWYHLYGSDQNNKIVLWTQPRDSSIATTKWTHTSETLTWQSAHVTVQSNLAYRMGFRAKILDGFVAVDDVIVTTGVCK